MATGYATPVRMGSVDGPLSTPLSAVRSEPSTPYSPLAAKDPFDAEAERLRVEQEAKRFTDARTTLSGAIELSSGLLDDLKRFSNGTWTILYPSSQPLPPDEPSPSPSAPNGRPLSPECNRTTSHPAQVSPERPAQPARAYTSSTSGYVSQSDGLTVLSVESFAGGKGRMLASAASGLAASLGRESLANLLLSHVGSVKTHLGDLRDRLRDGSSRILITGDLNAGKSTFVNALLGRDVAPVDQQPCTEIMCEIADASANEGAEEIHAVRRGAAYDPTDPETFVRFPVGKLDELVSIGADDDDESAQDQQSPYDMLKVYVEGRAASAAETDAVSLLRNGDITVSFIDAPGLNRDTVSTTSLFAKQSTIDVVIFVVSAENQFTLSAQEFLWAASQEKAYVFVVVNKWDAISNKARAERRVRDQIKKLSPRTWEGRKELIHFVDSRSASSNGSTDLADSFNHLERSLSSFVLSKRFVSKLQPAQTYLCNLLHDLSVIASVNTSAAGQQELEAGARLDRITPECDRLACAKVALEQGIDAVEESTVDGVRSASLASLSLALDSVADGRAHVKVEYPGLASIWAYAVDVHRALADTVEAEVRMAEDEARSRTTVGVRQIREDLGGRALPSDPTRNERVFNPEVMFAARRRKAVPLVGSVGLGLVDPAHDVRLMDLFELEHMAELAQKLVKPMADEGSLGLVGGLGVGSIALLGTGAASGKAFIDVLVRACDVLGSKAARKWAGTVLAVFTVGLGVYLVIDLPRAVPRNVGRRLRRRLDASASSPSPDGTPRPAAATSWADAESNRIAKETRKVLRLAGWDLRERFRSALESAQTEQDDARDSLRAAKEASRWLDEFKGRIEGVGRTVQEVDTGADWV